MVGIGLKIVACIPAYNESKSIGEIVRAAKKYCTEVIVCDDGSIDDTVKVSRLAGALVVQHQSNGGYGTVIKTLLQEAKKIKADVTVTLDSDGQHDPSEIPKVIKPILNGDCDMVIGSRFLSNKKNKPIPMYRSFGVKAITKLTKNLSYSHITDAQSGFRAYSKSALSKLVLFEDGMAISAEILMQAKDNNLLVKEVPITIRYDVENSSTHNPISHGLSVLTKVFTFMSVRHPMLFYTLPGVAFLFISILFMGFSLELFSNTRFVSTNMIMISLGSSIVGVVLIATGVILYTMSILIRGKIK